MGSSGWKVERLEDICSLITDGKHGDCQNEENSGYFFLSAKDILNGKLNYENARQITKHDFEETDKRTHLEPCDILITNSGTIGRMAFVTNHNLTRRTTFQKSVAILKPIKEKVYPPFLYYCLAARKTDIKNTASGTTQENLLLGDIRKFSISIPESIETQCRIADILSAFDDKIELNRQTNNTLEAIAQAIFKEWFVDFNYPGATGEMVESELGPIPKDWRVGKLGEILTLEIGGDWGTEEPDSDRVAVVCLRGTDLDKLKAVGYADEAPVRWIKENSLQKRNITETDILIGGSGLGPIGKSIYCDRNLQTLYDLPIIYSNFCKKLRARTPYEAMFAEKLLENIYISGEMRQFFSGTSIPNLDINSLLDNQVVIPEKRIITLFFNVIGKNKFAFLFNEENLHLSCLRDLLLPKLMNGEIEV